MVDILSKEKFQTVPDGINVSQCIFCKHKKRGKVCDAFEEIPEEILLNRFDHRQPYAGDNGIQFELNEDAKGEPSFEPIR